MREGFIHDTCRSAKDLKRHEIAFAYHPEIIGFDAISRIFEAFADVFYNLPIHIILGGL